MNDALIIPLAGNTGVIEMDNFAFVLKMDNFACVFCMCSEVLFESPRRHSQPSISPT